MSQAEITELLKSKIGMDAATVSPSAIASAIRQRMRANNCESEISYYLLLLNSGSELQEFIDTVTIPETWFLRDREPFNFLKQYAYTEWLPKHRNSTLRVLSVPCSSGEEPYSIAISLIEAGFNPRSFQIDGVDISQKVLQKARVGIYTKNSFRMCSPDFQSRYFRSDLKGSEIKIEKDEYELQAAIRNTVRFSHDNILDPQFGISRINFYDVIFCRNLLIYFDRSDRDRAVQRLHQMLANDGLLFVGHSEMGQIPQSLFAVIPNVKAYAYRKAISSSPFNPKLSPKLTDIPKEVMPETRRRENPLTESVSMKLTVKLAVKSVPNPLPTQSQPQDQTPNSELIDDARKLADRGMFKDAINVCESYLQQHRTNIEAYLLLAQIYQAQGNETTAVQFFQKVLYLNPKNQDALFHLSLLKEKTGDLAGAKILRDRLQHTPLPP